MRGVQPLSLSRKGTPKDNGGQRQRNAETQTKSVEPAEGKSNFSQLTPAISPIGFQQCVELVYGKVLTCSYELDLET
jgi:hypothetical protein